MSKKKKAKKTPKTPDLADRLDAIERRLAEVERRPPIILREIKVPCDRPVDPWHDYPWSPDIICCTKGQP